jgi:hypothetical protein
MIMNELIPPSLALGCPTACHVHARLRPQFLIPIHHSACSAPFIFSALLFPFLPPDSMMQPSSEALSSFDFSALQQVMQQQQLLGTDNNPGAALFDFGLQGSVPPSPSSALSSSGLGSPLMNGVPDLTALSNAGLGLNCGLDAASIAAAANSGVLDPMQNQLALLQAQQLYQQLAAAGLADQITPLLNLNNLLAQAQGLKNVNDLFGGDMQQRGTNGGMPTGSKIMGTGPLNNPLYKVSRMAWFTIPLSGQLRLHHMLAAWDLHAPHHLLLSLHGHFIPPTTVLPSMQTELCRSWEETGSCRYGGKCQFAHGREELRPVQRHPKYKTEVGMHIAHAWVISLTHVCMHALDWVPPPVHALQLRPCLGLGATTQQVPPPK